MPSSQSQPIQRLDYTPCNWRITATQLHFDLMPDSTVVTSHLQLQRVSEGALKLDGVGLNLLTIKVDGEELSSERFEVTENHLSIEALPDHCELNITTRVNPDANTALEGLYRSSGNYCTQCEAEGFRKITYYLDRPDVMSIFTVVIEANQSDYPVLLSNGNLTHKKTLDDGRHQATWHDPFPKPCYLFALVAGDLAFIHDTHTTGSGRVIDLYIYVQAHNLSQCNYAMGALQRSMQWDEDVYGLEYDLDQFMIVAVDDFNMGAMENKGLNIFNSKFVLADVDTATDTDFLGVEAVIAHEYFHNWTGNRVTCRDWFQISLKEGLTVFRDQEFSSDMHSRNVKRIEDVRLLRDRQFVEDSGPTAHPIRPDSYLEINNFYTLTVYEKGAEVIRMLHTLLGAKAYRAGCDLYFERHDGQAVTCDDFVAAMQDASGVDLEQFKRWYQYAGTPELTITDSYDGNQCRYELTVTQACPDTPGQTDKLPMHIPLEVGLLDQSGNGIKLCESDNSISRLLHIQKRSETFVFENISEKPIPSLLRNFSAPVNVAFDYSDSDLAYLIQYDEDNFNRWEASMRLATRLVQYQLQLESDEAALEKFDRASQAFTDATAALLTDTRLEAAFVAEALTIPTIDALASTQEVIDIHALAKARATVVKALAVAHQSKLIEITEAQRGVTHYEVGASAIGGRQLANRALLLLSSLDRGLWVPLAEVQFDEASNMTDRMGALKVLCSAPGSARDSRLEQFYSRYEAERLVVDKWFSVQATAEHDNVIDDVLKLTSHAAFDIRNPNRLRSLIGAFAMSNPVGFHREDGRGYELLTDYIIEVDARNPQIASRLVTPLIRYQQFAERPRRQMRGALERVAAVSNLSADVYEIVDKSLS